MKFQGREGLQWWIGVVEDRKDPKFLNRVRVRIYGVHTDDKQLIATPDLPWSQVMMPTTSPSLSGLGTTTHGLVEGSTVVGFYRDALDMQDPVVMGSFIGAPNQYYKQVGETRFHRTPTAGFNDPRLAVETDYEGTPDGKNPDHIKNRDYGLTLALDKSPRGQGGTTAVNYPKTSYAYTSDVNLLARADNLQLSALYPNIAEASGEPARSNYVKPTYPFNHVHETESGHVIELDDTPEYERLHAYHRSGTRVEVDNTGTYIEKIVRDKYTLILGSDTVKIQGAVDIEVGDSIASNSIATAGGATKIAETTSTDIVDAEGKLTEGAKTAITEAGGTAEDIEAVQEAVDEKKLGDKLKEATEGALDAYDDIKNNANIQTIASVVEGVNQGKSGYLSVITQVEEEIGTELNSDAKAAIAEVLAGGDFKDVAISKGIEIAKDKLTEVVKDTAVVQAIEAKLDTILEKAATSIEGMKAVVSEKVSGAVTSVMGEEAGAKAAEAMSGQMANAVSGVAMGAAMSLLSSALVNISVAGSAKVTTQGSTTMYSYGSTNVTSLMSTSITTLTGNTSLTTLLGTTTVSAPAGSVNVASPIVNLTAATINSAGVWNHVGAMNVTGLLTGTSIIAPIIQSGAAFLATHQHAIVGSPVNAVITGPTPPTG